MKIIVALLIFSILIVFHEYGHFLLAKACGVAVIEFSLGMGPRILSHVSRRSGTRYSWKVLPFGGSCQMKGEDEEDASEGSFGSKSVLKRVLIVAAGPVFNFILAFICSLFLIGAIGYDAPTVLKVTDGYPAAEAGIAAGDTITRINHTPVHFYRDISDYVTYHQREMAQQEEMTVRYVHNGAERTAVIIPKKTEDGRSVIGIAGSSAYRTKGNAFQTVLYSAYEVEYWIGTTVQSLRMLLTGQVSPEEVSGPVGVVKVIGDTYEESKRDGAYYVWLNMLQLSILLSANLGVMNLLPVPALDGGRLLFLIIEAVRGRKMDQRAEAAVNFAGFVFLMALMVLVLFHDTGKLIKA